MSTPVEIACVVKHVTDKAIKIADGSVEKVMDQKSGKLIQRDVLTWLPKSAVTVEPEDYHVGDTVTLTMSEVLATEKGLI